MSIVAIFSAAQCQGEEVSRLCAQKLGFTRLEEEMVERASRRFAVPAEKLRRAMTGPPFAFNKFTRQRERSLAYLKISLAELLNDCTLLHGFAAHLIPRENSQILKVCLVGDLEHRVNELKKEKSLSDKEARRILASADAECAQWTQSLFGLPPWEKSLYDLKLPMHTMPLSQAVEMICECALSEPLKANEKSQQGLNDFLISSQVGLALAERGHFHRIENEVGAITIIIDEYVLRLSALEEELKDIVGKMSGVKTVATRTGPNYRPASMFTEGEFDLPSRVLLVDDEKDFVLTLSERLEMRDMQPAIAYDGEQALDILKEEEPEVMVLDLKMPGIDGMEVLRRVKSAHPKVEVIILTGHGSKNDRELCLSLGAFAYLEKPVDIEILSQTMRAAYDRVKERN